MCTLSYCMWRLRTWCSAIGINGFVKKYLKSIFALVEWALNQKWAVCICGIVNIIFTVSSYKNIVVCAFYFCSWRNCLRTITIQHVLIHWSILSSDCWRWSMRWQCTFSFPIASKSVKKCGHFLFRAFRGVFFIHDPHF